MLIFLTPLSKREKKLFKEIRHYLFKYLSIISLTAPPKNGLCEQQENLNLVARLFYYECLST